MELRDGIEMELLLAYLVESVELLHTLLVSKVERCVKRRDPMLVPNLNGHPRRGSFWRFGLVGLRGGGLGSGRDCGDASRTVSLSYYTGAATDDSRPRPESPPTGPVVTGNLPFQGSSCDGAASQFARLCPRFPLFTRRRCIRLVDLRKRPLGRFTGNDAWNWLGGRQTAASYLST